MDHTLQAGLGGMVVELYSHFGPQGDLAVESQPVVQGLKN